MDERAMRYWQQVATALFTMTGSALTGAIIANRLDENIAAGVLLVSAVFMFFVGLRFLRKSLGPSGERWSLAQATMYLMGNNVLLNSSCVSYLREVFADNDHADRANLLRASVLLQHLGQSGKIRLEGVYWGSEGGNKNAMVQLVEPSHYLMKVIQYAPDNALQFLPDANPKVGDPYSFKRVVAYADEIRAVNPHADIPVKLTAESAGKKKK